MSETTADKERVDRKLFYCMDRPWVWFDMRDDDRVFWLILSFCFATEVKLNGFTPEAEAWASKLKDLLKKCSSADYAECKEEIDNK